MSRHVSSKLCFYIAKKTSYLPLKSKPNNAISLCFEFHSTTAFNTQEVQCVKGPPFCLWKQPERSAAVILCCWLHVDLAIKSCSGSEIKTCTTVWLGPSVPYKCTLELQFKHSHLWHGSAHRSLVHPIKRNTTQINILIPHKNGENQQVSDARDKLRVDSKEKKCVFVHVCADVWLIALAQIKQ